MITPKPARPPQFKESPEMPKIKLPKSEFKGIRLEDALMKRRSIREYSKKPITLTEFSQLLFSAQVLQAKCTAHF